MKLLYTAGPYGVKTAVNGIGNGIVKGDANNIKEAKITAALLWEWGYAVICPHANTDHFEDLCSATHQDYLEGDFLMISKCDGIVMLLGWQDSKGATMERDFAMDHKIPVFYWASSIDQYILRMGL